jgi:hypothetical protein
VQRCHKEQFEALAPDRLEELRGLLRQLAREERSGNSGEATLVVPQPRQVGAGS